jgi:predicted permease
MSWFSRLFNHFRSDDVSNEIQREMRFHLDERVDELMARGLPRAAAEREARRKFGSIAYQTESTRNRDLFAWLDILINDLRYAFRSLRSAPAFALVAILSLALGIGANTAIFSILNAVMLKSLPVAHPEELVAIVRDKDNDSFTNPMWEAVRDRHDMFSGVFAFGGADFNLTTGGEARRLSGLYVSGDYFRTLGVQMELGRAIRTEDDQRGCPGVVVLSSGYWRTAYGADPNIIGKTISLDGHALPIVGVSDQRFFGLTVGERPNFFIPICADETIRGKERTYLDRRSTWFLQAVGRPKPGLTPEQVNARFAALQPGIVQSTLPPDWPAEAVKHYLGAKFTVTPAAKGFSDLRTTYKKALYVLMAIVALVLLVASANVANLLLARAAVRQHEVAVRLALGAGRGRIARQLITESLLLSAIGATLGIAFAVWGSQLLPRLLSRGNTTVDLDLALDGRVLLFTIAVTTLTGLLFGLAPAWRAGRVDPQTAMKAQGRGVAEGHSRFAMGKTLVVAQIAMSMILVAGAGLLLGSWRRLATVDPGFRRDQLLIATVGIGPAQTKPEQRYALYSQILERFRAIPGVVHASGSDLTPIGGASWNDQVKTDDFTPASMKDGVVWVNAVSEDYFNTMGTPLLAGRDFDSRETKTSTPVAIVSSTMAKKFFKGAAIGKHFRLQEGKDWSAPIEVIGVVGDTKYRSLRDTAQAVMYFPRAHKAADNERLAIELHTNGPALSVASAVRNALAEIDPRYSFTLKTLDRQLNDSMTLMRTIASLSGFFGALALLLAMIGLYGIMAYGVARRRNEIGVRIALGAGQSRVIRMILSDTSRIVILGVLLGAAGSFAATRMVRTFLYGVQANDPSTLIGSGIALLIVGLAAAAIPAFRAARLDPVAALREE